MEADSRWWFNRACLLKMLSVAALWSALALANLGQGDLEPIRNVQDNPLLGPILLLVVLGLFLGVSGSVFLARATWLRWFGR